MHVILLVLFSTYVEHAEESTTVAELTSAGDDRRLNGQSEPPVSMQSWEQVLIWVQKEAGVDAVPPEA